MAHEFRQTFRQAFQRLDQIRLLQRSGDLKAGEMVGCLQVAQRRAQIPDASPACPSATALFVMRAPRIDPEIERPPHPGNPELVRDPRHRVQHRRQQMRVLMRIEMGGPNSRPHDLPHLRRQLLVDRQFAAQQRPHQFR